MEFLKTILLSALLAGIVAGAALTGLQALKVYPLIFAAEVFEDIVDEYESDGYETEGRYENTSGGDFNGGAQFTDSDHQVSISIFGSDGETSVSVTIAPAAE